jgi:hypothetical protein
MEIVDLSHEMGDVRYGILGLNIRNSQFEIIFLCPMLYAQKREKSK